MNLLHARTASFTSFQLWQLGVLAIRTYVRPQIRYPTHDNNPLFTPTHLRSCLKSGLPAECEVSLRSKVRRHVSCRQISKVRKIVFTKGGVVFTLNSKLYLPLFRLFPHTLLSLQKFTITHFIKEYEQIHKIYAKYFWYVGITTN